MELQLNFELRQVLEQQHNFEELLLEISVRFISLPVASIDDDIEDAQRRICETLNLDHSVLWQWSDKDAHIMTITHHYSPPDGPETPPDIDAIKVFPWFLQQALSSEIIAVSTEQLPAEASLDKVIRRF